MRKQRKMEYESPMICVTYTLEIESPIMNPSNDEKSMFKVDGVSESYYDEDHEDYLIKF